MRFTRWLMALAALTMVSACDSPDTKKAKEPDFATREAAAAFAATGSPFDYRYAFRLPSDRVRQVVESNSDACDKLGETRCQVLAMRYRVEDKTKVFAVLTLKIDPSIARGFGDAVTQAVTSANGVLVDTEIATGEGGMTRQPDVTGRLQDALDKAEAEGDSERAGRIRDALATIGEVEGDGKLSRAVTPILLTYESSGPLEVLGNGKANFDQAGDTLENSLAQMAQLLAGVGPWIVMLFVLVFILRWIIHRTEGAAEQRAAADPVPNAVPVDDDEREDSRNLIQRWFAGDDDEEDDR
jgi:hypothetical protein